MSASNSRHNRKVRRKVKKVLKHGKKAAPRHALISGRSGHVHSKRMASRRRKP